MIIKSKPSKRKNLKLQGKAKKVYRHRTVVIAHDVLRFKVTGT